MRDGLFRSIGAIMDHCGTRGMAYEDLRDEFNARLVLMEEEFAQMPEAAVFLDHIRTHYAKRPGSYLLSVGVC